jgi:opacity protein-like surface antigen
MMETRMKKILISAVLFAAMTAAASAMPLAPVEPAANTDVIQVAGGCGAGWHRGPYGGCLRNFADPAAHACPRGYHIGPGGACRGNGK